MQLASGQAVFVLLRDSAAAGVFTFIDVIVFVVDDVVDAASTADNICVSSAKATASSTLDGKGPDV